MKKAHSRSKLLKRCKNVRTSTKFVLDILRLLIERSCRCIVHTSQVSLIMLKNIVNYDLIFFICTYMNKLLDYNSCITS
jgi:hypothetical protein